ncbi:MAG: hypothetical protein U5L04_17510 [Trueperaceae bacterium]|nr:hypothetical protein [Trueperaceae bacterium]
MNDRYIDIVLVIGLLALVAAAVFLLLDERRSYDTQTRAAPLEQSQPAPGGSGITPVAPEGGGGPSAGTQATRPNTNIEPVLPSTTAPRRGATTTDDPATDPTTDTATETPSELPRPTDLEGAIALDQIGFDYARGNVGACNIPLEPWQHVAVSRDLLRDYGCGTRVIVVLPETIGGRDWVVAIVADTMSPSVERTVNVFISPDEPALQYGLLDAGQFAPAP